MLKSMDKLVDKLGTSFVQVLGLCAQSTAKRFGFAGRHYLYVADRTAYEHQGTKFAQPKAAIFNLLSSNFYPLSTPPIANTKLIKD